MAMATNIPKNHKLVDFIQGRYIHFSIVSTKNGDQFAHIIVKSLNNYVYFVNSVRAPHGYGPFLYDTAMRYLSRRGCYVISNDKAHSEYGIYGETSEDAQGVWDYYENHRLDVSRSKHGYYMLKEWEQYYNEPSFIIQTL